ncbi:MAG: hypothetical protein ACI4JA_00450 [Oscillospiraceae bacterium]
MNKLILCLAAAGVLALTACSGSDNDSSVSASSAGESAESSVQSQADVSEPEESAVTVFTNSSKLHDGVKLDDIEFVSKTNDFISTVTKNYQSAEVDENSSKGGYLNAELNDGGEAHSLYINQGDINFVRIDGDIYETTGGETAEFYEYATGYLKDKGYID